MPAICVHDRERLERFLNRRRELNFYHLGDLDDFFWPYTLWYGLEEASELRAVGLVYSGLNPPVLLAIGNGNPAEMRALLNEITPLLPKQIYAHLSPGLEKTMEGEYQMERHGEYTKMVLREASRLDEVDTGQVRSLGPQHFTELNQLYDTAYPGNWFDPRMLETGQYFGIRDDDGRLVSVAGVHVYSARYRVAALGNVTTRPEFRRQGLATGATAGLCKNLLKTVDTIGLNVKSDNEAAIRVYEKLGFEAVASYNEYMLEVRGGTG